MQHDFKIVNHDTDSILIAKPDGSAFSKEEKLILLAEINSLMPEKIRWADDGGYDTVVVVKSKNYVLKSGNKIKIKGSALKATMKEPALKQFINEIIQLLLADKKDEIPFLYSAYVSKIMNIRDISEWSFKKTLTKSIINPKRSNESRITSAIEGSEYNEGDKLSLFFKTETEYCLAENFTGEYCRRTLLNKLYKTLCIFETIIDITPVANYGNKRPFKVLTEIK